MRASIVSGQAALDRPPLAALLGRLRAEGHPGLSERKRLDALDPAPGSFGVLCDDEDGHLVAYARCVHGQHAAQHWTMELLVHPHWRGQVEPEVLAVLYVRLLTHGGGPLTWWTCDEDQERLARAWGWQLERSLARMVAPLPPAPVAPPPAGSVIRPFVDDHHGRTELVRLNNAAFGEHPEQGGWTLQDLSRRTRTDWYDPAHVTIVERDGSACGFCWLKWHAATRQVEVYAIGIDPAQRAPGLGRALLTDALHRFRVPDGGAALAMLHVDEANAAACALYRGLGFNTAARQVAYRVSIPDGRADRSTTQPHRLPGRQLRTSGPGR